MRTHSTLWALCLAIGCEGGGGSNKGNSGDVGQDDAGGGGMGDEGGEDGAGGEGAGGDDSTGSDTGEALPLDLLVDAPAFYDESDEIAITGRVINPGAALSLSAGGEPVEIADDGSFLAPWALGGAPWDVVALVLTGAEGEELKVTVQVARAEQRPLPWEDGLVTAVGEAGKVELAGYVDDFVLSYSLGPEESELVSDACDCPEYIECDGITEVMSATGAWSAEVVAQLRTSADGLEVDLTGTAITWELVVDQRINGFPNLVPGWATVELGDAPEVELTTMSGLPLEFGESHEWEIGSAGELYCLGGEEVEPVLEDFYSAFVTPSLESALLDWSLWLEAGLRNEAQGWSLSPQGWSDLEGFELRWSASSESAPSWRSPLGEPALVREAVDHHLYAPMYGAMLHQALSSALPSTFSAEGPGGEAVEIRLLGLAEGSASLASLAGGEALGLPAPISFELDLGGSLCEAGHAIPTLGAAPASSAGGAIDIWPMGASVVGTDNTVDCSIGATARDALLDAALVAALSEASATWSPAVGFVAGGSSLAPALGEGECSTSSAASLP